MNKNDLLATLDMTNEGIIAIDEQGGIKIFNKVAQEIFGIINYETQLHEAGRIEPGDLVIIADTGMGEDDGGLNAEDLEKIGIKSDALTEGCAFIGMGYYGDKNNTGKVKICTNNKEKFTWTENLGDIQIKAELDFDNKRASINFAGVEYFYDYKYTIGNIIVIDGKNNKVKFFQMKGYTARREAVAHLLRGGDFLAKKPYEGTLKLESKNIFEIFPKDDNESIVQMLAVLRGESPTYEDELKIINGLPTRCTLVNMVNSSKDRVVILKIEDITELNVVTRQRDKALATLEEVTKEAQDDSIDAFWGQSESIRLVKSMARKAATTSSNVLILGESGTGKGLLARLLHKQSKRAAAPFIVVNCASIPESLMESEFFGYDGGAFTGAKKEGKKGFFELAKGGTLFLDEIGELPLYMQAKLLHVLQDRSYMRVGGSDYIEIDVRVITATNKQLEKEVEQGNFRKDLYYRINVFPIYIPPLRMRKEDIMLLTYKLLPIICERMDIEEKRISPETLILFENYEWQGNVRELENVLEMAVNMCDTEIICRENIKLPELGKENHIASTLQERKARTEKELIVETLAAVQGNRKKAMEMLGIKKSSFYEKLKTYKIN